MIRGAELAGLGVLVGLGIVVGPGLLVALAAGVVLVGRWIS